MSEGIPDGWNHSKLGEIATLIMGQSPGSQTYNLEGIGLPFFQGKADFSQREAIVRYWCSEPIKIAHGGSILFSVRAPVGEINIAPKECCIGRGLAAIEAKKADQEFLFQYLRHSKSNFDAVAQGSTFEAINGNELKEFILLCPPLPEQQKIATILSSVDDVIEKTRAQIDKLKDLKTGMMQELLTQGIGHTEFKDSPLGRIPASWRVLQLASICKVQGGYAFNSTDAVENGCRWLKIANVGIGKVLWNDQDCLPNEFLLKHKNFVLKAGDIVLALTRPVISGKLKVARTSASDIPSLLNQRVARVIPKVDAVTNDYLLVLFSWENLATDIENEISGTDPPNVSTKQIENMSYAIPPIHEQGRIADIIFSISHRIDCSTKNLEQLMNIKKALMQDLLTGKVRVKLDQPETKVA